MPIATIVNNNVDQATSSLPSKAATSRSSRRQWSCDVCNKACFDDYKEALHHEARCRFNRRKQHNLKHLKHLSPPSTNDRLDVPKEVTICIKTNSSIERTSIQEEGEVSSSYSLDLLKQPSSTLLDAVVKKTPTSPTIETATTSNNSLELFDKLPSSPAKRKHTYTRTTGRRSKNYDYDCNYLAWSPRTTTADATKEQQIATTNNSYTVSSAPLPPPTEAALDSIEQSRILTTTRRKSCKMDHYYPLDSSQQKTTRDGITTPSSPVSPPPQLHRSVEPSNYSLQEASMPSPHSYPPQRNNITTINNGKGNNNNNNNFHQSRSKHRNSNSRWHQQKKDISILEPDPTKVVEGAKWVCDICKLAKFVRYVDAYKHEKICKGQKKETIAKSSYDYDEDHGYGYDECRDDDGDDPETRQLSALDDDGNNSYGYREFSMSGGNENRESPPSEQQQQNHRVFNFDNYDSSTIENLHNNNNNNNDQQQKANFDSTIPYCHEIDTATASSRILNNNNNKRRTTTSKTTTKSKLGKMGSTKWLCTVCEIQCFDDFETALRHEEYCAMRHRYHTQERIGF